MMKDSLRYKTILWMVWVQIALLPAKFALLVLYNVGRLHIIAEDGYYVHQVAETRLKIASRRPRLMHNGEAT